MNENLTGLDGVPCHMDDVLIFRRTAAEHDTRLKEVLKRVEAAGANLGYIIDKNGISADPQQVAAIAQMKQPANVPELHLLWASHIGWESSLSVLLNLSSH